MPNKFAWFEMHSNPDLIDFEDFQNGKIPDIYAMQEVIKEDLMQSNRKTMRWQTLAISKAVPTD